MRNICYLIFLTGFCLGAVQGESDWHYPTPAPNGVVNETEKWGGKCDAGRRQSPIDLTHAAAVIGEFTPFLFNNYVASIKNAAVTNTGHSIQINNQDQSVSAIGGGLVNKYVLDQMHFHWASEHTIDSKRYALELHMVHHDAQYPSMKEAADVHNGIAVLGVLFQISGKPNPNLDGILENMEEVRDHVGVPVALHKNIAPYNLMPKNTSSFFRYEGSLTTPSCGEAVIWTVFTEALPISIDQVEQFKTVHSDDGHELVINFRSLQPLYARALVYANDDNLNMKGSSNNMKSSIVTLITLCLCQVIRALL